MHKKTKRGLVWLGLASILTWVFATFSPIALRFIDGGLPAFATATVPQVVYMDLVAYTNSLVFGVIPALSSGYLLIGLFIFMIVERSKNDQS